MCRMQRRRPGEALAVGTAIFRPVQPAGPAERGLCGARHAELRCVRLESGGPRAFLPCP